MFAEDLSAFFNPGEFSVPCTLPGGVVVQVVFDDVGGNFLGAGLMEASQPAVLGRSADLAGLAHGAEVRVQAVDWTVVQSQPDGTGLTRLQLERAP